jgi:phosphotransferase system IIB component
VLLKNLTIAEACSLYSRTNCQFELASSKERASSKNCEKQQLHKNCKKFNHQMTRVRSTMRVTREGEEAEAAETAPISEVMRQSGLVMIEEVIGEGAPTAEAEQADIEEENDDEEEEDYNTMTPSKPSHLDFEKSTVSEADLPMMIKLGYFGEAEKKLIRFAGEETTPEPKNDEIVVFKSFFRAGLWFPLNEMIGEVLDNYDIYLHQLTPNAIVRLSVFIWALRSQGMDLNAKAFYRVHEIHY